MKNLLFSKENFVMERNWVFTLFYKKELKINCFWVKRVKMRNCKIKFKNVEKLE